MNQVSLNDTILPYSRFSEPTRSSFSLTCSRRLSLLLLAPLCLRILTVPVKPSLCLSVCLSVCLCGQDLPPAERERMLSFLVANKAMDLS